MSKSKPLKYIHITEDEFSFGTDPKDLKIQSQGSWQNGLTSKEVDFKLNDAKEDCGKPSGGQFYLITLIYSFKF